MGYWTSDGCHLLFQTHAVGLRVELSGEIATAQARRASWTRLAEEVGRTGAAAVLAVDLRGQALEPTEPARTQALLGSMDIAALLSVPLAYVGPWARLPGGEALNQVLIERGLHVQAFDDEAAAERWLRYGEHGRVARPGDHFSTKARSNT